MTHILIDSLVKYISGDPCHYCKILSLNMMLCVMDWQEICYYHAGYVMHVLCI
jgi:hypothetical protein